MTPTYEAMTMRSTLRALAVLTPLAVLPRLVHDPISAAPRIEGYAITVQITNSAGRGRDMGMTFKFAGDRFRLDPDPATMGGDNPQAAQMMVGVYMLVQPGGKVAIVMPAAGMGMSMNPSDMAGRGGPPPKCEKPTIEDLGAGEQVLGHATHRYRTKEMIPARGTIPAGEEVTEILAATDLPGADGLFRRFGETFGAQMGDSGCPGVMETFPKGFPMRTVSTKPGANGPVTERMEVTKIEKKDFSASDFEIPAGIRMMEGNPFGGRGRGNF